MKHSVGKTLTAGTANTVLLVPAGYKAIVYVLFISNLDGNNKTTTAYWQHAHDATHKIYIIDNYPMSAHSFIQFSSGEVVFQAGDSLIVTPEAGASQTVIVTFDLIKEASVPYIADN